MIIVVKKDSEERQLNNIIRWVQSYGVEVNVSKGEDSTILGLVGDTSKIDVELVKSMAVVDKVQRIQEPYKSANRKFHPEDTVIDVCGTKIGGGNFQIIAGPCSVESEEQIISIAKSVKAMGATILRGGAFKPRTSPYSFQGLKDIGVHLLLKAKEQTGMPIISEITSVNHLDLFENVDVIQVGARNMQNFELLRELGKLNKPIFLKRGLANTVEEWLMSAEYIMSGGNTQVILCERGIRTFEPYTRNTLDLSAVPIVKEKTHLPVFVDPSHGSGLSRLVLPMSLAAVGAGADGLMIEVHNNPEMALCDGAQSILPEKLGEIIEKIKVMLPLVNKNL